MASKEDALFTNFDDWKPVARSGNFIVKHFDDDSVKYYVVKTTSGNWSMVYRNDHSVYNVIDRYVTDTEDDEELGRVIDVICHLGYIMSTIVPDEEMYADALGAIDRYRKRVEEYVEKNGVKHEYKTEEEMAQEDMADDEVREAYGNLKDE